MNRHGSMRSSNRKSVFVKIAAVAIAVCMVAALALPAFAADSSSAASDSYTYTVRIFPGDKGTINGSDDPIIVSGIKPGSRWDATNFSYQKQAKSKTEKYTPTGIRESGKDNNTRAGGTKVGDNKYAGSFVVDRDIDLVVSYGIKGSETSYQIYYRDAATNELLSMDLLTDPNASHQNPETYYGNVGERPVVSYLPFEGYTPQYYNITGTLKANGAENVWTFYYNRIPEAAAEEETTPATGGGTTTTPGGTTTTTTTTTRTTTGTTTGGTTAGGTAAGGTAAGGTAGAGTATGAAGTPTGTGTAAGTTPATPGANEGTGVANAGTAPQNNGPQEIVDVDEQQTPLAEYDNSSEGSTEEVGAASVNNETEGEIRARGMSTPAKVLLALAIILALGGAGWFFFRRFAMENEDDEDDDEDDDDFEA